MSTRTYAAMVRFALWVCGCAFVAPGALAQCTNPTAVPNGTYTTGDHSVPQATALSAGAFVISGSATATFSATNCIHLGPGFSASAGGANTFQAWVDVGPTAVSVTPSGSTGVSGTFSWTVSSPSGAGDLASTFLAFNTSAVGTNGCYLQYSPASGVLSLADNAGQNWSGFVWTNAAGSASNSQCSISGNGASVASSGNQLTVTVPVTFFNSFSGLMNQYVIAFDNAGWSTGWQALGSWTVAQPQYYLSTSVAPTGGGSVTPASGWYSPGSPVTLTATPNTGYRFSGFSGTASSGASPLGLTVNGSTTETANFTAYPVLTVRSTHSGDFTQGQVGATYTISVGNSGIGSTDGSTITLTDFLPPGLIPASIAGSSWTCTQPAGPCSRSDILTPGASYPSITVTAAVAPNAPTSVTNQPTVSGGGSSIANASDATTIDAVPRYANALAFATTASVVGGVSTTLTVTYTDDNGASDIGSGQVKIDNCYFAWDTAGNVRLYGSQNGQPDATGILSQNASIWAGNCTINLASSSLTSPAANPKARVLSLSITFPEQSFFSTSDSNVPPDFLGQHEVYAWGNTAGGLATGQIDLGALTVTQGQDFTLNLTPSGPVTIATNTALNLTLSARGVNGFSGSIALTNQLQQLGSSCLALTGSPASIAANSQVTISVQNSNCQGFAQALLHVQGTAGGISRPAVNTPMFTEATTNSDFTIGVGSPSPATLAPSGTITFPLTVSSVNGITGNVSLAISSSLPAGVTCYFSPSQVSLYGYGSTANSSMICYGSTNTPGSSFSAALTASGPSQSHTAPFTLSTQVTTFQVTSVTGSSIVHNTGQEVQVTQNVPGGNAPSYSSCDTADPNVTCRVVSSSSGTVTLGLTAGLGAIHGPRVVRLNGGASTVHAMIGDGGLGRLDILPPEIIAGQTTPATIDGVGPSPPCGEDSYCFVDPQLIVEGPLGPVTWAFGSGIGSGYSLRALFSPPANAAGNYQVYVDLCGGFWDPDEEDPDACFLGPADLVVDSPPPPPPTTISLGNTIIASSDGSAPPCPASLCNLYVGKQLTLTGSPTGGTWTIPGVIANSWDPPSSKVTEVDLPSNPNPVSFFWIAGGTMVVHYSANGQSTVVQFAVAAPTPSSNPPRLQGGASGPSTLDPDKPSVPTLYAAAQLTGNYSSPQGVSGLLSWIQVVTSLVITASGPNLPPTSCSPAGTSPWLDTSNPYPFTNSNSGSSQLRDGPGVNLTKLPSGATHVIRQIVFADYLMWQVPALTASTFQVPLLTTGWTINDSADLVNGTWVPSGGTTGPQQGLLTTSYPAWSSTATAQSITCIN